MRLDEDAPVKKKPGPRTRRKRRRKIIHRVVIPLLAVIAVIVIAFSLVRISLKRVEAAEERAEVKLFIDGQDMTGMPMAQALEYFSMKYPWSLNVVHEGETTSLTDLVRPEIEKKVEEAYKAEEEAENQEDNRSLFEKLKSGGAKKDDIVLEFSFEFPGEEAAERLFAEVPADWGTEAVNASIEGYDAESNTFRVVEGHKGNAPDHDTLMADIAGALRDHDYTKTIEAVDVPISPEIGPEDFKVMSTYTTHTTSNAKRNTNVELAAKAVNGTIILPGETFSYNEVVGPRTEEKGYQQAPAYADGQTVQEYGGGVCQISSTLYNAVVDAGLETTVRKGHTFEPSYVTPGQDATVSYPEPDFQFVNNSKSAIGIKASFADRTVVIELFGVPILEEGVTRHMESEKKSDLEVPVPTYVEDPTVPFGLELPGKSGTAGSIWITNIVTEKNGEVISSEYLHRTQYRGHSGTIRRNTLYPNGIFPVLIPDGTQTPETQPQEGMQ
ncbi:MAG: VanW family protein [Lachnospiraceae bacterium]|nr:VanW family protein [Lachnospiraceae bacterium]